MVWVYFEKLAEAIVHDIGTKTGDKYFLEFNLKSLLSYYIFCGLERIPFSGYKNCVVQYTI